MDNPQRDPAVASSQMQSDANSNNYGTYLGGIDNFAPASDQFGSGDEDIKDFFHPDLFDGSDMGSNNLQPQQQQPQTTQQPQSHGFGSPAFNQHAVRQSQSPALPAFTPTPQPFQQHPQYSQNPFDSRMYQQQQQPAYDPRFYQPRPSHSPSPLEQYQYSQHHNFTPHAYQQPMHMTQRDSATLNNQHADPRRPAYSQYMSFDSRSPQMYSQQNNSMSAYPAFEEQSQRSAHFVDPALLNAGQMNSMNGNYGSVPQQSAQPSPYFSKAGSTMDPRALTIQQFQRQQQQMHQPGGQAGLLHHIQPSATTKIKAVKDPNAPKRPRGRPRKDGSMPRQRALGSASTSDSELDVEDDEEPEMTPAVLSVMMPTDERGKALHNAVQAVWSPRNKAVSVEKVKSGISLFGETVKTLRDAWRAKNETLKKAELPNAPTAANVPQLKNDVANFRQLMEGVMARSLQYAHPSILKRLGDNQWTMSAMYTFMLDRVTVGDFDSTLTSSILKLAINFETVDKEQLETVKWPKLLLRLTKKANNESKSLAQKMIDNATAATSRKMKAGPSSPGPNGELAAGVKRSRDGEAMTSLAKRPLVKPSSRPLALQNAEKRRVQLAEAKKTEKVGAAINGNASAVAAKTKSPAAAPVKASTFSALMSASKRPGTTNAERAAAAKEKASLISAQLANVKKESVKRESPPRNTQVPAPTKPQSSFLGFLSDFEKKTDSKPEQEEVVLDETPEQKAKRERKEARRKLRVSWKADSDLVETKLFQHDPDEEMGHDDSMMQDAGDTMKEGEMLKKHHGMDDLEDEEGDEPTLIEYSPPSEIDFSDVQSLSQDNYTKTGGTQTPASGSSVAQEKLEANSVMVVYTFQSDRPSTPKEAPEEDEEEFEPCAALGEPNEMTRTREKEHWARLQKPFDLAAHLQGINPGNAVQQSSTPAFNLQQAMGLPFQPQQAAAPQATINVESLAKIMAAITNVKQHMGSQPQQQHPTTNQTATPLPTDQQTGPPPDLTSLLASLHGGQPGGALPLGAGSNPNPYPGSGDDSRKHGLDDANGGKAKKKKGNKVPAGESLPYNYKTQTCSFWKEGKCTKGDSCTYRHDD